MDGCPRNEGPAQQRGRQAVVDHPTREAQLERATSEAAVGGAERPVEVTRAVSRRMPDGVSCDSRIALRSGPAFRRRVRRGCALGEPSSPALAIVATVGFGWHRGASAASATAAGLAAATASCCCRRRRRCSSSSSTTSVISGGRRRGAIPMRLRPAISARLRRARCRRVGDRRRRHPLQLRREPA